MAINTPCSPLDAVRFNPPTESGHGKLVSAVQHHAEKTGGSHYIFPSHSQDKKKNPLTHDQKVGVMKKLFTGANVQSHSHIRTAIDAMKHLENIGHTHVTMVVGSDRVQNFHKLLNDYNGKEYNFKKINVASAGHRDPDAEGAEGMSASKMRGLVSAGKKDEFVNQYSDKKLGTEIHDKVHKAMNESKAMFILGGPGSGKDYVINNILNRFGLVEVQLDQILNGSAKELIESKADLLINATSELDKITLVKSMLENYTFDHTIVSVTNKVSRERNETRNKPMNESTRIRKWLDAEKASHVFENSFVFVNSINLREASDKELNLFQNQIAGYLAYLLDNGYQMNEMQEVGTDAYRDHAISMTPGQGTIKPATISTKPLSKKKKIVPPDNVNSRIDGSGGYSLGGLTIPEAKQALKDACWKGYTAIGTKKKNGKTVPNCVPEEKKAMSFKDFVNEAEYQGREVPLNKPMKGDVKKSKVFVKDPETGNVKKVNFGDKTLSIKKHIPGRKKSYCARSGGQGNTTDKTKANYWSRKAWDC